MIYGADKLGTAKPTTKPLALFVVINGQMKRKRVWKNAHKQVRDDSKRKAT
jgi:hypothetical protein